MAFNMIDISSEFCGHSIFNFCITISIWKPSPYILPQEYILAHSPHFCPLSPILAKPHLFLACDKAKMGSIKDRNGMDLTDAEDSKKRWQEYTEELYKKHLHDPANHDGVITQPRARHPGMWSQVGLRKHHYERSYWSWWNSSCAISNPERWCCESVALNMPPNLENRTGNGQF